MALRPTFRTLSLVQTWQHPSVHTQSLSRAWLLATPCPVARWASFVHGIFRQEYWSELSFSSSRRSSQPRDQTCSSGISCLGRQVLYLQHRMESQNSKCEKTLNILWKKQGWSVLHEQDWPGPSSHPAHGDSSLVLYGAWAEHGLLPTAHLPASPTLGEGPHLGKCRWVNVVGVGGHLDGSGWRMHWTDMLQGWEEKRGRSRKILCFVPCSSTLKKAEMHRDKFSSILISTMPKLSHLLELNLKFLNISFILKGKTPV